MKCQIAAPEIRLLGREHGVSLRDHCDLRNTFRGLRARRSIASRKQIPDRRKLFTTFPAPPEPFFGLLSAVQKPVTRLVQFMLHRVLLPARRHIVVHLPHPTVILFTRLSFPKGNSTSRPCFNAFAISAKMKFRMRTDCRRKRPRSWSCFTRYARPMFLDGVTMASNATLSFGTSRTRKGMFDLPELKAAAAPLRNGSKSPRRM